MTKKQSKYMLWKRTIGLIGSIVGFVFCFSLLWWWIIPINAVVTKGHPFFVQERYGRNKKVFKLIKFRTLKLTAEQYLAPSTIKKDALQNMETGFGRFLRRTSLDETPQIINVFLGQMAFIGPRPGSARNEEYLVECREKYTPSAYEVRPGISGYAQIKMNRGHNPELKAQWDHEYVMRMSFIFDASIFIYTILKIFGAVKGR